MTKSEPVSCLPHRWRRWIAQCLLEGITPDRVARVLEREGIPRSEILREVRAQSTDPCLQAGEALAARVRKLERILGLQAELRALSPALRQIERRSAVSRQEFLERYYAANRPVVLNDVARGWRAVEAWGPAYLKAALGERVVEVTADRDAGEPHEIDARHRRRAMRFAEFVDAITSEPPPDLYIVGHNRLLEDEGAGGLWEDFSFDSRYLDPAQARGSVCLWFGPAGTITPLHHDVSNLLFTQVLGRKRVTLISALESHRVYNDVGVFSRVNPDAPDLERFPRFGGVHTMEVVLEPGDTLFIPVCWWHHVVSLDVSVSLSFTNFIFSNHYRVPDPSVKR